MPPGDEFDPPMYRKDDFDRSQEALGEDWTTVYTGPNTGMMATDSPVVVWVPTRKPGGLEITFVTATCAVCGHEVTVTETIYYGDPRLCEHMGGPTQS